MTRKSPLLARLRQAAPPRSLFKLPRDDFAVAPTGASASAKRRRRGLRDQFGMWVDVALLLVVVGGALLFVALGGFFA